MSYQASGDTIRWFREQLDKVGDGWQPPPICDAAGGCDVRCFLQRGHGGPHLGVSLVHGLTAWIELPPVEMVTIDLRISEDE